MNHLEAEKMLFDTGFFLGGLRRRKAMEFLMGKGDAQAVAILADAVEKGHSKADAVKAHLVSLLEEEPRNALWEKWAAERWRWLEALLQQGGVAATAPDDLAVLSRLKLGDHALDPELSVGQMVARYRADEDSDVSLNAWAYLDSLAEQSKTIQLRILLECGEYEKIGCETETFVCLAETVASAGAALTEAADHFVTALSRSDGTRALLELGRMREITMDRATAWTVLASRQELSPAGIAQADAYTDRVISEQPAFVVPFIFKAGRGSQLEQSRPVISQALSALADEDEDVRLGAESYVRSLPNQEQYNDLIVDEWIRTGSPFLKALAGEPRLPSDPAKEALIRLVNGDLDGYRALQDENGALLTEALALASPEMRQAINETILNARDGALADAYRMAMAAGAEGADSEIGIRALIASGNEDGLVEATRTMLLSEVLPLCDHWAETGRRPENEKYAEIVERALTARSGMPEIEIEPAPDLPKGLEDLFEVWRRESGEPEQIRKNLESPDPFVRAGALFMGSERGVVDEAMLREKAKSKDWPERLVASLRGGRDPDAGEDHVAWVNTVAGLDADLLVAPIACGPEDMQWTDNLCRRLRDTHGAVAQHNLALAETLAAFRSLYGGQIVVSADDSAQQKEAVEVVEDVSADELSF
jgi:hypothetical protein